jgi:hypothetical protein
MSPRNGEHRCALCGEDFELPEGGGARTTIAGASGKPNVQIVAVNGEEVHRCEAKRCTPAKSNRRWARRRHATW